MVFNSPVKQPRLYCPLSTLAVGQTVHLPDAVVRHVQVLRLAAGNTIVLFNNEPPYGEFTCRVLQVRRDSVAVQIESFDAIHRENRRAIHLAFGMPTGDRMDRLVEKAIELGASSLQPLMTERTILRIADERANKKVAHWQAIVQSACEQCGRNYIPPVHPIRSLDDWIKNLPAIEHKIVLDISGWPSSTLLDQPNTQSCLVLSGPEGGLSPSELQTAQTHGFEAINLGARILRADTAPWAALIMWS